MLSQCETFFKQDNMQVIHFHVDNEKAIGSNQMEQVTTRETTRECLFKFCSSNIMVVERNIITSENICACDLVGKESHESRESARRPGKFSIIKH